MSINSTASFSLGNCPASLHEFRRLDLKTLSFKGKAAEKQSSLVPSCLPQHNGILSGVDVSGSEFNTQGKSDEVCPCRNTHRLRKEVRFSLFPKEKTQNTQVATQPFREMMGKCVQVVPPLSWLHSLLKSSKTPLIYGFYTPQGITLR